MQSICIVFTTSIFESVTFKKVPWLKLTPLSKWKFMTHDHDHDFFDHMNHMGPFKRKGQNSIAVFNIMWNNQIMDFSTKWMVGRFIMIANQWCFCWFVRVTPRHLFVSKLKYLWRPNHSPLRIASRFLRSLNQAQFKLFLLSAGK